MPPATMSAVSYEDVAGTPAPLLEQSALDRFWSAAAVVALVLHAAALAGVLWWRTPAPPLQARLTIELVAPAPEAPPPPLPPPAPPELVVETPPPEPVKPVAIEEPPPVIVAKALEPDPAPRIRVPPPRPRPTAPEPKVEPPPEQLVVAPTPPRPAPRTEEPPPPVRSPVRVGPPPDYLSRLYAQIERRKTYPRAAQARRQQGVVHMRFTIDRGGRLLTEGVARGSGSDILDAAAEDVVRRAAPFPPMPDDLPGEQLEIVIPLEYALR